MGAELRPYQAKAAAFIAATPKCALWMQPGLGKTRTVLHSLEGMPGNAIIIAPLRVCYQVWPAEIAKWGYFLTYHIAHGKTKYLDMTKHINIVNVDAVPWLYEQMYHNKEYRFDTCVIDESSLFKNPQSKRFKALKALPFKRMIQLTGTPAPNSLLDIWPQIGLLDGGNALEKGITAYRDKYFYPLVAKGHVVYKWGIKPGAADVIYERVRPLVLQMDVIDYLDLEPMVRNEIKVNLPPAALKTYREAQKKLFLALEPESVSIKNMAHLTNVCQQIANGSVYCDQQLNLPGIPGGDRPVEVIHTAKLEALDSLVSELAGQPLLVAFTYHHDLTALLKIFPDAAVITGKTPISDSILTLKRWNSAEIPILLANISALSHGLNLQDGGNNICFYSLTWSLEKHDQFIARLHRSGQTKPVMVHYLIAEGTIDVAIMARLAIKDKQQFDLLAALNEYRSLLDV